MISPFEFLVTALAVWRLVVFVRQDALIEGTREKAQVFLGRRDSLWSEKLLLLIQCQWCLGIWFALFAVLAWIPFADFSITGAVVTWLGLAATASLVDLIADRL